MPGAVRYIGVMIVLLCLCYRSHAQNPAIKDLSYEITIAAQYNLPEQATDADRLQMLMSANPQAAAALSSVEVHSFTQKFPHSHYAYLRNIYKLTCANSYSNDSAVKSLHSADPLHFSYIRQMPEVVALGTYYPNDYHGNSQVDCSAQLDYIHAPEAWAITKGNPKITIGINDPSGFDIHHPDLVGKILGIDSGNTPDFHGTIVAGCAAAHTDNGIGVAGIGFNCTMSLDSRGGDDVNLHMSQNGIRVVNNSWFYGFNCTRTYQPSLFVEDELVYDEVYENGTTICFAAGNGLSGYGHCTSLFDFAYPASLDHIITVGPVSHQNAVGTYAVVNSSTPPPGIPWLWRDCHEESPGNSIGEDVTLNYEANSRVDICAPAYNVASTFYSPSDSSQHYTGNACGTSFASPIVTGTVGLMLSANPCLTTYQIESQLKNSARNMDFVEYPPGSGINMNRFYVGKMGAGALDAGAAVTAASTFDCNDTSTQTMYVDGVEINTICAPGYSSNGVKPKLSVVVEHGLAPYTYRWDPIPGNNTTLDDYTSASPTVTSGTFAAYRLGVYDASPVQKEASRLIVLNLTTDQTPKLVMRDSYMDMMNEANTQASVDGYDWQIWLSPDLVNRIADDHTFTNQNPVYAPSVSNYVNARVRNVGCTASTGTEHLNLYWTKSGTAETWPGDWTTATFKNTSTGAAWPAGGQITASPISVPVIAPGEADSFSAAWLPPSPTNYSATETNVGVSLLGRIESTSAAPYGMTNAEVANTATNALRNNKIATRSLIVNGNGGNMQWHQVLVANTDNADQTFSLEFATERQLHPSFSGDISAYVRFEVKLGDLYDRWIAGGKQGTNVLINAGAKSVIFSGDNKITLKGITLHANEKFTMQVGVIMEQQPLVDQYFHIRQWIDTAEAETEVPYGSVSLLIPGCAGDTSCHPAQAQQPGNISLSSMVSVFPNPVYSQLSMVYMGYDENTLGYTISDISGQIVQKASGYAVSYGVTNTINLTSLQPGLYFVKVTDKDNKATIIKIVKV